VSPAIRFLATAPLWLPLIALELGLEIIAMGWAVCAALLLAIAMYFRKASQCVHYLITLLLPVTPDEESKTDEHIADHR
jgi:hypothetical protein